jgi:hypothetical protein
MTSLKIDYIVNFSFVFVHKVLCCQNVFPIVQLVMASNTHKAMIPSIGFKDKVNYRSFMSEADRDPRTRPGR